MAEIPDKLKQVVSDSHLAQIAERIGEWEMLVDYLEITDYEVVEIKRNDRDSYGLQKRSFLRKWKQKYGDRATYYCLIEAVKEVSSQQYLASFINELLGMHYTLDKNVLHFMQVSQRICLMVSDIAKFTNRDSIVQGIF